MVTVKDGFIIKSHLTKCNWVQEIQLTQDGNGGEVTEELTTWEENRRRCGPVLSSGVMFHCDTGKIT